MTRWSTGRPEQQRAVRGAPPGSRPSRPQGHPARSPGSQSQRRAGAGRAAAGYGAPGHPSQGGQSSQGHTGQRPTGRGPSGSSRPATDRAATDRAATDRAEPPRATGNYGVAARGRGRPYQPAAAHRPGRLARFVETYGWRAYAIPVLVVATFLCSVDLAHSPRQPGPASTGSVDTRSAAARPQPEPRDTRIYAELPEDNPSGGRAGSTPTGALPAGTAPYATRGRGTFHVVPGTSAVFGRGPLQQYTVEVEDGVRTDEWAFAAEVEEILGDRRGWGSGRRASFQRVDNPGRAAFRVSLTSTMTVRELCGYTVRSETSCYNGAVGRAVINDARWVRGAMSYGRDLAGYHQYVITHEVGHRYGHHHELCGTPGAPAPVMMQQTLSTGRCRPNPWPFPDGVHEVTGPPAPSNLPVGN